MTQTPSKPTANSTGRGNKRRSKTWMIIAVLLIIVIAGLLIFFLPKLRSYKELAEEKEAQRTLLQYELEELMSAHDSIKMEYGVGEIGGWIG